jgi:hypothetical protein
MSVLPARIANWPAARQEWLLNLHKPNGSIAVEVSNAAADASRTCESTIKER